MTLLKHALPQLSASPSLQTVFAKRVQRLKSSVAYLQDTMQQTVTTLEKNGKELKPEHQLAIDQLARLWQMLTPAKAPSDHVGFCDTETSFTPLPTPLRVPEKPTVSKPITDVL